MPTTRPCPALAVIGAGFCGALLAIHAARAGLAVTLIERSGSFGPGLAYGVAAGSAGALHLLNTPAGRMSAFAADPEHFVRWAQGRGLAATGGSFLPRAVYGAYLAELLRAAGACPAGQVTGPGIACLTGQVVAVEPAAAGVLVRLADGRRLDFDRAALCVGNLPP
ncbi:MAG: FAD/NAD(P)-binding protein, partial [Myxococcales bacterium]|nr:FAD/NAD(P)-binding protein [Myxococcales bacterium]